MKRKILLCLTVLVLVITSLTVGFSAGAVSDKTVISANTKYRYLDDNTDPASGTGKLTSWTSPTFDDSLWKTGTFSFGSVKGSIGVVNKNTPNVGLNFYKSGNSGDAIPTYFFRTTFELDKPQDYNKITINADVDDSFAIYINGTKIVDTRNQVNSTTTNLYYSGGEAYKNFTYCYNPSDAILYKGTNVVAVEVHNDSPTSSDVYFAINRMTLSYEEIPELIVAEQRTITPGRNETERNLAWFSTIEAAGEIRLAEADRVVNGVFPSDYKSFSVTSTPEKIYHGIKYVKNATLKGLNENTRYAYVIEAGGYVSDVYYFNVGSFDAFEFAYISDAQLTSENSATAWNDTLDKIINGFGVDLLVSGGDQVDIGDSLALYNVFLSEELSGITFAPSVGPGHESPSVLYTEHYNLPNLSTKYGVTIPSANYYYIYNNVLFMHLNSPDRSAYTNGEHAKFVEETMKANPYVDWAIVVMHYSLFTTGRYAEDDSMMSYRNALAPKLTELGVDLVLSGHDHVYARSHIMNGTSVGQKLNNGGSVYEPGGTVYLNPGSSTGTKFYNKTVSNTAYTAVDKYDTRVAVKISVEGAKLTVSSYDLANMSVFDTFTIEKEKVIHVCDLLTVKGRPATCVAAGQKTYYRCACGKAYEDAQGQTLISDPTEWAVIPMDPDAHIGPAATCISEARCVSCGVVYGQIADHTYEDSYATDSTYHWKTCLVCGNEEFLGKHVDVGGVGECKLCKYPMPKQDKNNTGKDNNLVTIVVISVAAVGAGLAVFLVLRKRKTKI